MTLQEIQDGVRLVSEIALTTVGSFFAILLLLGFIFEIFWEPQPRKKMEKGNSGERL